MNPNEPIDPVVNRTRHAREALAKKCDFDLDKMYELLRTMQSRHPERVSAPAAGESRRPFAPTGEAGV